MDSEIHYYYDTGPYFIIQYELCELRAFVVLEPHQVLVSITDRSPRYNNNTNTRQNKTLFHNESQIFWRFSCIT